MADPKKNTAYTFDVGLIDATDPTTIKQNPTLAPGDVQVQTDDGGYANAATLPTGAAGTPNVKVSLSADEMNGERTHVWFKDQTSPPEWQELLVTVTYGTANVDSLSARIPAALTGEGNIKADTLRVAGTPQTAGDLAAGQTTLLSKLLKYIQLALRKDAAIATDNATELTAINANGGSGAGAFDNTAEAQEALRDRGDAAWVTGGDATAANQTSIINALAALRVKKNTALANFTFPMFATGTNTPLAGLTVTATRSLDGAAFAACANAVSAIGAGYYVIDLDATDLNGNVVMLLFTATGADPLPITIITQP